MRAVAGESPPVQGVSRCLICNGNLARRFAIYDDRYGYPGYFDLYRCCKCSHGQLLADFLPEQLTALYTDYYPRSTFDLASYKPSPAAHGFRSWLNGSRRSAYLWVPENVRVLDIGCGFGQTLGYHEARGCDVYGVEADRNILRVAQRYGFKVNVGLYDPQIYPENYFDYVTMDQVLEHMLDPLAALRGVARILKPGGVAVVSTPNADGWGAHLFGRRWINWHAPYHLQHFTPKSARHAAEMCGFVVESVLTITSSEWLFYQWNHLLLYPCAGQPSVFWAPKAERGRREQLVLQALAKLHRTKLNHLLTRVFDALGAGDNILVFLRKS